MSIETRFNTFVKENYVPNESKHEVIDYPDTVDFHNLLEPEHDYFQIYIPCKLKNSLKIFLIYKLDTHTLST